MNITEIYNSELSTIKNIIDDGYLLEYEEDGKI